MSVKKAFAFVKGTDTIVHASKSLEGVEYEWNSRPVHPVLRKWFAYNPRSVTRRTYVERYADSRESTAHVATKMLLQRGTPINCDADARRLLLLLRDVVVECPANNRIPDVTGFVEYCWPYWNLYGQEMHIEVHFENRVRDPGRKADLQALGAPVLEIHLPAKYIKSVEDAIEHHQQYLAFLKYFDVSIVIGIATTPGPEPIATRPPLPENCAV